MQELGHQLRPLDEVREQVLSYVEPLPSETLDLRDSHGRVLRQDVVSRDLLPPFDNSAMDGYAVRVEDLADASGDNPITLSVTARIQAGDAPDAPLASGTSMRIMTGAPMPPEAQAVVPHELTTFTDSKVTFTKPVRDGQNVRRAGGDVKPDEVPLESGCELRSPQIAIAGALGHATIDVTSVPKIGILSPGDELVDISEAPSGGKIRNSNAHAVAALIREAGAEPVDLGIVVDTVEALRETIERGLAAGVDGFVSTGGVSAGDFDFVQKIVREEADPGFVFKVAMRPGKPQVFGLFGGKPFFGLPGNPAAAVISFEVFVRPALRKMRGMRDLLPELFQVRFPFEYPYKAGRVFLLRTRVEPDPAGGYRVVKPGSQDSSFLSSLATSNAIVVLPSEGGPVPEGEVRPAFWLGSSRP